MDLTPTDRSMAVTLASLLAHDVEIPREAANEYAKWLDRIAGETRIGESRVSFHNASEIRAVPARFTPYSGRCWRCGTDAMGGKARMCSECWGHFTNDPSAYDDTKLRALIEAEERGKPCNET